MDYTTMDSALVVSSHTDSDTERDCYGILHTAFYSSLLGRIMTTIDQITDILKKGFPGGEVYVKNPLGDGAHFSAIVVCDAFEGQSLVTRHRAVLSLMKEALKHDVHALSFKTFTPTEWESKKDQFTRFTK